MKKNDGRKTKPTTKTVISITISEENFQKLSSVDMNKSKFINWLIQQHYGKEEIV